MDGLGHVSDRSKLAVQMVSITVVPPIPCNEVAVGCLRNLPPRQLPPHPPPPFPPPSLARYAARRRIPSWLKVCRAPLPQDMLRFRMWDAGYLPSMVSPLPLPPPAPSPCFLLCAQYLQILIWLEVSRTSCPPVTGIPSRPGSRP